MQSSRTVPFRSKPSAVFEVLRAELQRTTLFLVARSGPSVFSIKDTSASSAGDNGNSSSSSSSSSGVSYKIVIGNPHSCTCGNNSNSELCIHQLFCLLKVLRVPDSHPLSYQLALTDTELDQVLNGILSDRNARGRHRSTGNNNSRTALTLTLPSSDNLVARQELDDSGDHICPICQDDVSPSQALTWCRKGCGNNIHANCMQTFAQYKVSNREVVVCPLCREQWALEWLRDDCKGKASLRNSCLSVHCTSCKQRLKSGIFFRCVECSNSSGGAGLNVGFRKYEDYCENCYPSINITHALHHFVSSDVSCDSFKEVKWQPSVNPRKAAAPLVNDDILRELQARELSDEDYDWLLRLDSNNLDFPSLLVQSLPIFRPLLHNTSSMQKKMCWCKCDLHSSVSSGTYSSGINANGTFRILPCKHIVHDKCMESSISRCIAENNSSNHAVYKLTCSHQFCRVKLFIALNRKRKATEKINKQQHDKDESTSITSASISVSSSGMASIVNSLPLDVSGRGLAWRSADPALLMNTGGQISTRCGRTPTDAAAATITINNRPTLADQGSTPLRRSYLRSLTPTGSRPSAALPASEAISGVSLNPRINSGGGAQSSNVDSGGIRGAVRSIRESRRGAARGAPGPHVDFTNAVTHTVYAVSAPLSSSLQSSSFAGVNGVLCLNGIASDSMNGMTINNETSVNSGSSNIQKIKSLQRLLRTSPGHRLMQQGRLINLTPVGSQHDSVAGLALGNTSGT